MDQLHSDHADIDVNGNIVCQNLTVRGYLTVAVTDVAATSYPVVATDNIVGVSAAAARLVTLPDPATTPRGRRIMVKDTQGDADSHTITVKSAAGNIDGTDGATGVTITAAYGSKAFVNTGTDWLVV